MSRHKRRASRARFIVALTAAIALTGGALFTSSMVSSADAATGWPPSNGGRP
ncbi:hypothetical protein ACIHCQ_15760 [Streptomyces sp. NPDC052236]|uniref:hypothetical protein n=1 Tax=Streptomyces sp. NPDC052236 TaxID=3365686 RepID=UPI0037D43DC9